MLEIKEQRLVTENVLEELTKKIILYARETRMTEEQIMQAMAKVKKYMKRNALIPEDEMEKSFFEEKISGEKVDK